MKTLQINVLDSGGGANAVNRLHQGLLNQGIDSRLLVGISKIQSDRIKTTPSRNRLDKLICSMTWRLGLNYVDTISSLKISEHPFFQDTEILNFHNLHGGYFNYLAIPKLTEYKPAVWTLHDMWSLTGHCVYSYDCDRWKIGCGKCPYPDTYPGIQMDNTYLEWRLKNWVYSRSNLVIVTLTKWLTEEAKQSMLNRFPIHHIPNGIDSEAYQPLDPELCKQILGIPKDKKVLMFAAQNIQDNRKGGDLLLKILSDLPESLKSETLLLILGNGGEAISQMVGISAINLGYITGDRMKSIAYSSADLFLCPTRADNLPMVLQESMACGTAMVSFDVGGVPDLVRPNITGYLAKAEDPNDFRNGIIQLLEDINLREKMGQNGRAIVLQEYSLELQAQRYMTLYQEILAR